jgi:hypothetical protein
MSTANLQSKRFDNVNIITSILIDEANNAETTANAETPSSGLFLTPSTVAGRAADVTGFLVVAATEEGKLEFSDPDGFLSLDDLSDVTITDADENDLLYFDGTVWVNGLPPSILASGATATLGHDPATAAGATSLFGLYGEAPVIQQVAAGAAGNFDADTSGILDGTATYNGYTVEDIVVALQAYGLLA